MTEQTIAPVEQITSLILTLREQRVILDSDLARLYGVSTGQFNQAVKRNLNRFPPDFLLQVTLEENGILKSQNVISSGGHGGRRKLPYVFTEHGAVMAAMILNSPKAVEVSVYVVRAFIQQRAMLAAHADLSLQLARLERKLITSVNLLREHDDTLTAHESQLETLIEAINDIRTPPATSRRPIGFRAGEDEV